MKDTGIFLGCEKKQRDFFGLQKKELTRDFLGYAKKVVIFGVDKF